MSFESDTLISDYRRVEFAGREATDTRIVRKELPSDSQSLFTRHGMEPPEARIFLQKNITIQAYVKTQGPKIPKITLHLYSAEVGGEILTTFICTSNCSLGSLEGNRGYWKESDYRKLDDYLRDRLSEQYLESREKVREAQSKQRDKIEAFQNQHNAALIVATKFTGESPEPDYADASGNPECGRDRIRTNPIRVGKNGGLRDVVVDIVKSPSFPDYDTGVESVKNNQCNLDPRVTTIRTRQVLLLSDHDRGLHNWRITERASGYPEFSLNTFQGDHKKVHFEEPGIYLIECNIHPWETGIVYVTKHGHTRVTTEDGQAVFRNLPPGEYSLQTWHEHFGTRETTIRLGEGEQEEVTFFYPDRQSEGSTRALLHRPLPEVPKWFGSKEETVQVMVRYTVNQVGQVPSLEIVRSSGFSALDDRVLQSVRGWRFEPASDTETRRGVFTFTLSSKSPSVHYRTQKSSPSSPGDS